MWKCPASQVAFLSIWAFQFFCHIPRKHSITFPESCWGWPYFANRIGSSIYMVGRCSSFSLSLLVICGIYSDSVYFTCFWLGVIIFYIASYLSKAVLIQKHMFPSKKAWFSFRSLFFAIISFGFSSKSHPSPWMFHHFPMIVHHEKPRTPRARLSGGSPRLSARCSRPSCGRWIRSWRAPRIPSWPGEARAMVELPWGKYPTWLGNARENHGNAGKSHDLP